MQHTSPPVKKVTAKKPRRLKWILLITTLIIASPFLIHYGTTELHRWQMRSYLENKYNQEFIVERPERKGSGLGVEGHMEAIAYPKDDSVLKFEVKKTSSDTWDRYADKLWANEETRRVRQRLDGVMLGDDYEYHISIGSHLVRADIKHPLPSLDEFLHRHGKNILYTLEVKNNSNTDRTINYDKAVLLMRLVKEKNINVRFIYRWTEGGREHIVSIDEKDIDKILGGHINIEEFDRTT